MRKSNGFTLVELIVVIVILGILAVTAAPKFIDLQGDARAAVVNGLKGSLKSAVSMAHAKALVQGKEKYTGDMCLSGSSLDKCPSDKIIKMSNGFPYICCGNYDALPKLIDGFNDNFEASSAGPGEWTYIRMKGSAYPSFTYVSGREKYIMAPDACGVIFRYQISDSYPMVIYELTEGC